MEHRLRLELSTLAARKNVLLLKRSFEFLAGAGRSLALRPFDERFSRGSKFRALENANRVEHSRIEESSIDEEESSGALGLALFAKFEVETTELGAEFELEGFPRPLSPSEFAERALEDSLAVDVGAFGARVSGSRDGEVR